MGKVSDEIRLGYVRVRVYKLGPDWYRIFGADADTDIREQENSDI